MAIFFRFQRLATSGIIHFHLTKVEGMHQAAITKIAAKISTEKPVIQRINQLLFLVFVINPIYFIQKMFDTIRIIGVMYFHFGTKRTDRSLQTKTEIKVLSQEVERHIIEIIYLHLPQQVTQKFPVVHRYSLLPRIYQVKTTPSQYFRSEFVKKLICQISPTLFLVTLITPQQPGQFHYFDPAVRTLSDIGFQFIQSQIFTYNSTNFFL